MDILVVKGQKVLRTLSVPIQSFDESSAPNFGFFVEQTAIPWSPTKES